MSYDATQQAERRTQTRRHIIVDVRYVQTIAAGLPIEQSPIRCSCGAYTTSGGWERHRGMTVDSIRHARNKSAKATAA